MVRGRGTVRGRGINRAVGPPLTLKRYFIPRYPFDLTLCEGSFPKVKLGPNENELTTALLKKNSDLSPTSREQTCVLNLVTMLQNTLDNLIVSPQSFEACHLQEVRQVGSFKMGTMIKGYNVADIAVILKTLPTNTAVETLGKKVQCDLKIQNPKEDFVLIQKEYGFDLANNEARVRILITTLHQNLRKLESDQHLDRNICMCNLAAIRHSRWFEENANHSSIKILVRLIKDLKNRFDGLKPLTPWILSILSFNAVTNTVNKQALSINQAFKRVLQLLSSGIFLPGSAGIIDPCEAGNIRIHIGMKLEDQDLVCMTAQTLLRILTHGGHRPILEGGNKLVAEMSIWSGGVVASPLEKAYESAEPEAEDTNGNDKIVIID